MKTEDKEYFYDDRGNCIEWTSTRGSCGMSINHWKGTYNENDSLISSSNDSYIDSFFDNKKTLEYKQHQDSSGKIFMKEVFGDYGLVSTIYYEYYD